MNIRQIFNSGRGYSFKEYEGTFGVEIETETQSLSNYPSHFFHLAGTEKDLNKYDLDSIYWYAIEDHSLRNYGMEFVLKKPLPLVNCIDAFDEFAAMTKKVQFIDCPPGASVHVHVNMLPESLMTLANFITLWVMFENILVEYCGVSRRSNLFALPTRVAEENIKHYCNLFKYLDEKQDQAISNFSEEYGKYSSLNITTLCRLGTVEVRTMRGTTDVSVLKVWVSILQRLLDYARLKKTPYDILQSVKEDSTDLFYKVFGPYTDDLINANWQEQLDRNLHYVYSLVNAVPNWDTFGQYELKEEVKKKPKKTSNTITLGDVTIDDASLNSLQNQTVVATGTAIDPTHWTWATNTAQGYGSAYLGNTVPQTPSIPVQPQGMYTILDYTDEEISQMNEDEFTQYISMIENAA